MEFGGLAQQPAIRHETRSLFGRTGVFEEGCFFGGIFRGWFVWEPSHGHTKALGFQIGIGDSAPVHHVSQTETTMLACPVV